MTNLEKYLVEIVAIHTYSVQKWRRGDKCEEYCNSISDCKICVDEMMGWLKAEAED